MLTKHRAEFLLALGAVFFSASGLIVTVILKYMPAFHLAQFRSISAVLILGTYVLLTRPQILKAKKSEIKRFAIYGVVGFALVNFGYLLGIERGVPLGLVLILEFTASIWIALWIKLIRKGYVANEMWLAVFLSFSGLILVSKVWNGFKFDLIGLVASLLCAFALAAYFLMSEKIGNPPAKRGNRMTHRDVVRLVFEGKRPPYVPWSMGFTKEAPVRRNCCTVRQSMMRVKLQA